MVGHTGICSSAGVIYDFAGPYTINEDRMAFGRPTRFWPIPHDDISDVVWDAAVNDAATEYRKRMHNICCDNCHSHVAMALNLMHGSGSRWNMGTIGLACFFRGQFVDRSGVWKVLA